MRSDSDGTVRLWPLKRRPSGRRLGGVWSLAALTGLAAGAPSSAAAFELRVKDPVFVVSVPQLPDLPITAAATEGPDGPKRLIGVDGNYRIEVVSSPTGKASMSTRECAGLVLRRLVKQAGMPDRDSIYRAPLDAQTFLVIYRAALQAPQPELHAHLLAAVPGGYCIEAHVSRAAQDGEDEDLWRQTFRGAHIDDGTR